MCYSCFEGGPAGLSGNGRYNGGCGCGCNGGCWSNAIRNLFDTSSWYRSGCGCDGGAGIALSGQGGGGCNSGCGCGSNADLSAYTACGNQCYDAYYAQQYALYPYGSGCGCGS